MDAERSRAERAFRSFDPDDAGDVVEVNTPGGTREYEILEVRYV